MISRVGFAALLLGELAVCSRALITTNGVGAAEASGPAQQKAAHAAKYEAEFTVVLNMTDSSYRNKGVGIVLDIEDNDTPVKVSQIETDGLQAEWNAKHPDKQILVGDQISQANDYVWHSNSRNFVKRLWRLIRDGRALDPSSEELLSMHVLRPRKQQATEFVVELPLPAASVRGTSAAILGWELNSTATSQQVLVSKIGQEGAVAEWNKANPDAMIREGDEVIKVNGLQGQNSTVSEALDQIEAIRSVSLSLNRTLGLTIRRPMEAEAEAPPAQEAPPEQAPPPRQDPAAPKQVRLRFPKPTSNMPAFKAVGWQLAVHNKSRVVVKSVEEKGLVADWNAKHPSMAVEPDDQIIQVDGAVWQEGSNPSDFMRKIAKAMTAASLEGPGRACRLALARPQRSAPEAEAEAARAAPTLSPGWESTIDAATNKVYYFNRATGQSSWTPV
ncbi:unnamed protein product [Prorocentrum cordatum]|uniref:PDZ domain-containing protein n=1 Tax=Prorocentrum cordatum TaxID=2364126 RepID=A0ABN9WMV5_9DINO|nr:unnamed protein product [Polarella glacialis]|mmetsp:Transcript_101515/g.264720  ORF Transcript_101515/g.264720 Transcript_101515/m.264720 type:complete len:445 (-) Transcript_101515:239-1573(-)